ncbi:MAG: class I SAM-dependent methyltransferase [Cyanobacteria bacterium J06639_1]
MNRNRPTAEHPVIREYAKQAKTYDSRWAFYVRATTNATIARLPDDLGDILDVGCGTGALLSRLAIAAPETRVVGMDASADMLDVARSRLPNRVELREGWAEKIPFGDASFDTAISCNMFHYIRNPQIALDEIFRVLRPGGTLVLTDWCDDYWVCKLCDVYLRWFDPSHFRMYGLSQCRELLNATEAHSIAIETYKISWLWGLMTAIATKSPHG